MTIKYLSQTDAAKRLGVSRQRVSQLVAARHLKGKEFGGRLLISESELSRFAAIPRKGGRPRSNS